MATAITYSNFGGPEVLHVSQVEPMAPGPGQIRVRVRATTVNGIDVKLRRGMNPKASFPVIPGLDVAGMIDEVGDGASATIDAEILGVADGGSYAELALVSHWASKPADLSWELAAAIPTVGEAAYRALKHLDLRPGETLLVTGAAGSVGGLATQLAVSRGVRVIGSASAADQDRLRSYGAVPVRYDQDWVSEVRGLAPDGVDAALDTAGAGVLPQLIELAGGVLRVITIADVGAQQLGVRFTGGDPGDRAWESLKQLASLASSGQLDLPIDRSYALTDAAAAHAHFESGHRSGKLVLTV
ncbi:MAG: NADP-dependent oxidoreductase [Actinomycetota bacterium]|nr:NADP-dependent oxidoreductase [Actinomycetota bacterium]